MRVAKLTNGFTILEVVVTIVVASLVISGLSVMVNNIRVINNRSGDLVQINSIIEDKIEQLRSRTYLSLSNGNYDFTNELPPTIAKSKQASYAVSSVNGSSYLKKVVLTITYNDFGKAKTLSYVTYIGELGVGQY
jgi:prepilin-type N-terminal cleavage/methylation domain-containing protein